MPGRQSVLNHGLGIVPDATAHHPIGIADNDVLSVDDAAAQDNEFVRFTANGLEALTIGETLAALLGSALPVNVGIILATTLSNNQYSGIVVDGTAGASLAFGDLVYLDTDSKWKLADADAEATAGPVKIGICLLAGSGDEETVILLYGNVRADTPFPTLTIGASVHIGLTAGDIQVAAPSVSGDIVRIVGYGNTANELFFCPDNTYVEIA